MSDTEVLDEIVRRLRVHFDTPGYAEENAGYANVLDMINQLRTFGQ
jgi:hypothetical protein